MTINTTKNDCAPAALQLMLMLMPMLMLMLSKLAATAQCLTFHSTKQAVLTYRCEELYIFTNICSYKAKAVHAQKNRHSVKDLLTGRHSVGCQTCVQRWYWLHPQRLLRCRLLMMHAALHAGSGHLCCQHCLTTHHAC